MSLMLWSSSGMASPGKEDGGVGSTVCESICISEVMPNADGSDQGMFPQGEWVELVNSGNYDVNLYGWAIVDIGGWYHPINEQSWVGLMPWSPLMFSDLGVCHHSRERDWHTQVK